jgi:purine catabolism regulator
MTLKVKDILDMNFMKNAKIIAGEKGIDREIKYVDIIEVPDIEGWINEGGLFLTTGYSIKDNYLAQKKLVNYLNDHNSAALCIKRGRYFNKIPEVILNTGNELDLPVIELSVNTSYVDILLPLIGEVLEKEAYLLKRSEEIHKELTNVVLMGGGIDHIAQTLYKLIPRPVLIQNKDQEIMALIGKPEEERIIKQCLDIPIKEIKKKLDNNNIIRINENKNISRLMAPIVVSGHIFGYVSIFEIGIKKIEKIDYRAVEHAATVIALEILKEKEKMETDKRLKTELLTDLIQQNYSEEKTIIKRARYFDWDFNKDYLVVVIDIDDLESYYLNLEYQDEKHIQEVKDKIKELVRWELIMESKEVILINKSDSLVIFYDCQSLKTKEIRKRNSIEFAEKIKKIILKRLPQINISIGIGNFYSGISGLRSSYNESYRAIKMGKKIYKENGIYHYDDLGIFKVLVELENDQVLKEYREEILGPLLNEANKDLIDTVKALLEHMGNKSEAAEELNIHRNSLNYRINKFSKLLDIDLENSENWLKIFLALKINEIL